VGGALTIAWRPTSPWMVHATPYPAAYPGMMSGPHAPAPAYPPIPPPREAHPAPPTPPPAAPVGHAPLSHRLCPRCGLSCPAAMKYCPRCGSALPWAPT
jgi:hypothetical protein